MPFSPYVGRGRAAIFVGDLYSIPGFLFSYFPRASVRRMNRGARDLLAYLYRQLRHQSWPSDKAAADRLRCDPSTISRYYGVLKAEGFIGGGNKHYRLLWHPDMAATVAKTYRLVYDQQQELFPRAVVAAPPPEPAGPVAMPDPAPVAAPSPLAAQWPLTVRAIHAYFPGAE